jgi:peptidoglycan/LPS O-acetylase OafA/YrhL
VLSLPCRRAAALLCCSLLLIAFAFSPDHYHVATLLSLFVIGCCVAVLGCYCTEAVASAQAVVPSAVAGLLLLLFQSPSGSGNGSYARLQVTAG